jgi:tryptophan-rich sensory protein
MSRAPRHTQPTSSTTSSPWIAISFVLVPLILGFIPPGLVFGLNPNAASSIGLNAVGTPAWVFVGVWLVSYSGMGLAAWLGWQRRVERDACTPIAMLCASFLITLTFWLSNSLHMTATLDAINLILAWTTLWVYSKLSKPAALYLLPWAIWMPVTLTLKLLALGHGLN